MPEDQYLPPPIAVSGKEGFDSLVSKEWLIANQIGAYASSTAAGCNTRRYHGLLVAAALPPVGRIMALSTVMEELTVAGTKYELATNEFPDAVAPRGFERLSQFVNDTAPRFVYRAGRARLVKEVLLAESANVVGLRYRLEGAAGRLVLRPFAALRDYHHLRKLTQPAPITFELIRGGVRIADRLQPARSLYVQADGATFQPQPVWWNRFHYRADIARGQDSGEDLYSPGRFECDLQPGQSFELYAGFEEPQPFDFEQTLHRRRRRLAELAASLGPQADQTARRLAMAGDAFVVQRSFSDVSASTTILAGYHWFADWGRDAFVSLPGLLLTTRRFEQARQVFLTFARALSDGMIPNCFDDYSPTAHYNSIDASLWFIIAAERYLQASGDRDFWQRQLLPVINTILGRYRDGTRFGIRADADGLLAGGSHHTQLTWMDVKLGQEVVTPRHGLAVEVNALWYCAHRLMAQRCREIDSHLAGHYAHLADLIGPAFVKAFWNPHQNCLHDCVGEAGQVDSSLRPNQILAVSLPCSPLSEPQQAAVVRAVAEHLLTPLGLRTLSPPDPRYRRRYGGSWESRDRAYHQGTVWAWLMGPFVEAYLKVNQHKPFAAAQARRWLEAFDEHLDQAGLGTISEIFDGDSPHAPRGCIAQAWSVAEVLRAKMLLAELGNQPAKS